MVIVKKQSIITYCVIYFLDLCANMKMILHHVNGMNLKKHCFLYKGLFVTSKVLGLTSK